MTVEDAGTGFKRQYTPDIRTEIVAFANTDGGTILVGVDDDGTSIGLENPAEVMARIANALRDGVQPDISLFVAYETLPGNILRITVSSGTRKPYYVTEKGIRPSGIPVRQGTTCAPASWEQIRQMIKLTDGDQYESERSIEQNLTFTAAAEEFNRRGVPLEETKYAALGIRNSDGLYTNLGLILSDQCPHSIKAAVFEDDAGTVFRDRKEFTGSILRQLRDAYDYLCLSNHIESRILGLDRVDSEDFPQEALREALLNAVVHREYTFSGSTIINVYAARMEFISLGGLVRGLQEQDIRMGVSMPRNPRLAGVFYRLRHIESYGTGIRKIFDAYVGFPRQPQIRLSENVFVVDLPNRNRSSAGSRPVRYAVLAELSPTGVGQDAEAFSSHSVQAESGTPRLSPRQAEVLALLNTAGSITPKMVQEALGIGQTRAYALIAELLDAKRIQRTGKGRNKRYEAANVPEGAALSRLPYEA